MDYFAFDELVLSVKPYFPEDDVSDIVVIGYKALGAVELEKELTGETDSLKTLAALSESRRGTVIAAFISENGASAAVAHKGRLYDISDCSFGKAGRLKVFRHGRSRFGLLVDSDALNAHLWEKLRGWCDFVISVALKVDEDFAERVGALSAAALLPVLCTDGENTFCTLPRVKNTGYGG